MDVLIVKTSSLGDVIHTFPVLEYLVRQQKVQSVDWVVEKPFRNLVASHPLVNRVLEVNTRSWRKKLFSRQVQGEIKEFTHILQEKHYDVAFDLQGNLKSGLLLSRAQADKKVGFEWSSLPEKPNFLFTNLRFPVSRKQNIRNVYLQLVQSYFHDSQEYEINPCDLIGADLVAVEQQLSEVSSPTVLLCPHARWKNKQLPLEILTAWLRDLSEAYGFAFLVCWGNEEELEKAQKIVDLVPGQASVCSERLDFASLQHLMNRVALVISMDSFPLHLSGLASTPTYSVFGPSRAEVYCPPNISHRSFQGTCPYSESFEFRCPQLRSCKTGACMRQLTSEELMGHFRAWWEKLITKV